MDFTHHQVLDRLDGSILTCIAGGFCLHPQRINGCSCSNCSPRCEQVSFLLVVEISSHFHLLLAKSLDHRLGLNAEGSIPVVEK